MATSTASPASTTFSAADLAARTIHRRAVEPPQPKDAAMLAMLASIGIEKGKPFQPDAIRASS